MRQIKQLPFNSKDWRGDVRISRLNLQQKGFYLELMNECILTESDRLKLDLNYYARLFRTRNTSISNVLGVLQKTGLLKIENDIIILHIMEEY